MRRGNVAAVSAALCVLTVASPARADLPAADTVWIEQSPASTWFKSDLLAAAEVGGELWAGGYQGQVEFLWPTDDWKTVVLRPPKPLLRRYSGGSWQNIDLPSINYGLIGDMEAAGPQDLWVLGARYVWGVASPYLARWDGSAWTSVSLPPGLSSSTDLAAAPDAVFVADADGDRRLRTYTGGQWTTGPDSLSIVQLASHPEGGAWLLGDDGGTRVVARWDSGSWQNIPLPEGSTVDRIYVLGQDDLLAHVDGHYRRWDGSAWTPVGPPRALVASDAVLSPSGTLWLLEGHFVTNLVGSTWSTQLTPLPDYDYTVYIRSVTTAADRLWITGRHSDKPVAAFAAS
ncbi:hypothetical protein ABGB12_05025 [Actinocorallia sp. B10E7]|uniref:hypothetical protein n=1 Tax=Actinocorallia sp. B10E7 TaxID=3153558 RepID=UPI00325EC50D